MTLEFSKLISLGWPQLILLGAAFITLLTSVGSTDRGNRLTTLLAAGAFLWSGYGFWILWRQGSRVALDFLIFDPFGNLLGVILSAIGFVTVVVSYRYWRGQVEAIPEAVPLLVFSTLGMTLMVATTHLLTFVLALEVMSLGLYVMVGMRRNDPRSGEAAFKYFLLGSVAAAFLLFGISFLYGATGTLDANLMANSFIPADRALIFKLGVLLVLLGLAFKVAAVPLHFWAPDAYDGAPMPITGFMATGVKVAAFGAFIRFVQAWVGWEALSMQSLLVALSLVTMIVGNLTALRQKSLKRIMAYSSISHAGYLLLGMATLVDGSNFRMESLSPLIFYLAVYGLLTLGAFAVLTTLSGDGKELGDLDELDALASSRPGLAAILSIFLISLAGIPPSAGFLAKYYLFSQAIQVGLYPLAIVGILTSAVSLYYYLAPVVRMYFYPGKEKAPAPLLGFGVKALMVLMVLGVFYLGLLPGKTLQETQETRLLSPETTSVQVPAPKALQQLIHK